MMSTEKIPLEGLVKWLDGKLKTTKKELGEKTVQVANLRNQVSDRDKALAKKTLRITALENEVTQLRHDFKKEYKSTEWYKDMCRQLAERNEALKNLRRNYNSVLSELNKLRDKYGE